MDNANSQPSPQSPTLIVVLGMHRSGTSVATRALETLGASFGSNLGGAVAGVNPKGFFEDMDVMGFDIELMNATGVDWFALPAADFGRLETAQLEALQSRALALLGAKCSSGIFALKDPRICRLLPFWQPVFNQLDARVLYVVAFRHPISVARSLAARDSLPAEQSYLLWLAHVVAALRHTSGLPRALVNYDTMMETPGNALKRLSMDLGLPLDPARRETFEREFLEAGLRHTRFASADLEHINNAPTALKVLFRSLEKFADEPSPAHGQDLDEALTRAEAFLADTAPLLARDWDLEQELRQARRRVDEIEGESAERECRSAAFENGLTQATSRIAVLERELEQALARVRSREQESQAASVRINELEREQQTALALIGELKQERHCAHTRIETLEQHCRTVEAAVTARQREIDQTVTTLNSVLASTSWRVTAPLRAVRRKLAHSA
ncbi:conserved hypothetical protein [Paraburkholderia unamae]|uniref:sulfotransferase family protein n=1 Tax=Paraburkholderia unamae TaxID=219649 RepID=UPI001CABF95C|nr:hypothetical protein [Paraburkholderia unamae]CAG9255621.1 conserved hypothetical protein [Paraburkholderia unamae]